MMPFGLSMQSATLSSNRSDRTRMKTGKTAKMIRNNRVEMRIKNQVHFTDPERTANVFESLLSGN
jgi:hypothetical protein